MKTRRLIIAAFMLIAPALVYGQGKGHGNGKGNGHGNGKAKHNNGHNTVYREKGNGNKADRRYTKGGPPPWAPAHGYRAKQHAYFPDYYTFYDANRNGYVFWQDNGWTFSPNIPSFLNGVNLGTSRLQILNDVPLTTHPEAYYNKYSSMYPAHSVTITVPVPR